MKKLFISLAIIAGISLSGCNDSFLEKSPVTDLTEENAFNSYDNFKALCGLAMKCLRIIPSVLL